MNSELESINMTEPTYPPSVALKEFKTSILNSVNNSGLPAWMMLDTMLAIVGDISKIANEEIKKDAEEYNKAMKEFCDKQQ